MAIVLQSDKRERFGFLIKRPHVDLRQAFTLIEALILKPADKIYFNIDFKMGRSLPVTAHMLLITSWLAYA